jgi:hypothetical protein
MVARATGGTVMGRAEMAEAVMGGLFPYGLSYSTSWASPYSDIRLSASISVT